MYICLQRLKIPVARINVRHNIVHSRLAKTSTCLNMDNSSVVSVQQGQLRGKVCTDFFGKPYYSFQGVPYAKPPVNELRFKAPQAPDQWTGIRDATAEGQSSYSRHLLYLNIIGSEDCLYLNVYTPTLAIPLKPVMFWIHGGGYIAGSGLSDFYGPDFLIHEDVVIVTFNYRLGMLGFLSLNDSSLNVPGNAGLKDQVMALKWVRANIAQFGGDPNNITIFGESVGGGSVHHLILSPMSKGLFHKAIIQSGSAIGNRGRGQYSTPVLADALNLKSCSDKDILTILKEMPVEKIFELQEKVPDRYYVSDFRPFGAVVETFTNEDTFLSKEPIDIIKSGVYNDVPVMIGFTSREGYFARTKYGKKQVDGDFENEIMFSFNLKKGSELSRKVAGKIKDFFYGDQEPSTLNTDAYYLLQTDTMFLRPLYKSAKLHCNTSKNPIYLYRMSIDSKLNLFKQHYRITDQGVSHADDLGYLFKNMRTPKLLSRSIEENGMRVFTKLWTNFAKTGNPNPSKKDKLINVTWQPVQKGEMHFLDIGENITIGVNPERERMEFWDEIDELCNRSNIQHV